MDCCCSSPTTRWLVCSLVYTLDKALYLEGPSPLPLCLPWLGLGFYSPRDFAQDELFGYCLCFCTCFAPDSPSLRNLFLLSLLLCTLFLPGARLQKAFVHQLLVQSSQKDLFGKYSILGSSSALGPGAQVTLFGS